jgi:hypothetical protein
MSESSQAPSFENPLDVVPNDETLGDRTAGDATRPAGEVNAYTDGSDPRGERGRLGDDAASDDLAHLQDGELVSEQDHSIDTPDDLGGVGGEPAGGAG